MLDGTSLMWFTLAVLILLRLMSWVTTWYTDNVYSEDYGKSLTILELDKAGGYSDPDDFNGYDELLTD